MPVTSLCNSITANLPSPCPSPLTVMHISIRLFGMGPTNLRTLTLMEGFEFYSGGAYVLMHMDKHLHMFV